MPQKIKIMTVFGTRPEAIKMAPLVLELKKRSELDCLVCVTGQHRDMLDSVLHTFGIEPDFDLNIMKKAQSLTDITTGILKSLGAVLREAKPDLVLVHGDTSTAFSSALAAFYEKIPVGHVEAGLRSFDPMSPYPEEMNRMLISRIGKYHFAPTKQNAENLRNEGVTEDIFITGNTVIDALGYTVTDGGFNSPQLRDVDFAGKRVIAMTCHRRENYGKPMEDIFHAVKRLSRDFPDTEIVYPVHLSPAVRETASKILGDTPGIRLIDPLDTEDMHKLMSRSYLVLTDSGGLQEEAPSLGKPVLVLRRETERPEAVEAGTVKMAGVDGDVIYSMASELLSSSDVYEKMARAVNPYGDGRASERIADYILNSFGHSDIKPQEFSI